MKRQGLWLLLAASAWVLGACSTTAPPMSMTARKTAPAPQGWKWNAFATPSNEMRLAFGLPDSDALALSFSCRRKKSPTVGFFSALSGGKPGAGEVRLRSGKAQGRYAARLTPSEISDGLDAVGEIPLADAVLAAFEKSGLISQVEDKAYPLDARTAAERADIQRFFGFCRE